MSELLGYLVAKDSDQVKLHLGCGGVRWKDFVNIDLHPYDHSTLDTSRHGCVADVYADIRDLRLASESVDEIFTSHTFEHFPRWEGIEMLKDWHRMLKVGGRAVIESPDFWRCVLWLFHPRARKRKFGRTQFYGNQWDRLDFETHRYVWSSRELKDVCLEIGFQRVVVSHRTETHMPGRDMRLTVTK